jgi:hypothetical protein
MAGLDTQLIALRPAPPPIDRAALAEPITRAQRWLLERQSAEGWWRGELEADATLERAAGSRSTRAGRPTCRSPAWRTWPSRWPAWRTRGCAGPET